MYLQCFAVMRAQVTAGIATRRMFSWEKATSDQQAKAVGSMASAVRLLKLLAALIILAVAAAATEVLLLPRQC